MNNLQSLRGMVDLLPEQTRRWQQVESIAREHFRRASLEEIRIIESDYLNSLKNKKPNVIICSGYMIVRGEVENQLIFPCNQDHLLDYYQVR